MNKSDQKVYNFFSIFFTLMFLVAVLLTAILSASNSEAKYIEPLNKQQQQAIVSQIGIDGYKQLIKAKCYKSIVVRVRTKRWSDQYCAKSYRHLKFGKIERGEL